MGGHRVGGHPSLNNNSRAGTDTCCHRRKGRGGGGDASSEDNSSDTAEPCRCCLHQHQLATMEIVIVGAGLAGLSTAISLEQVGYRNITIYERGHDVRPGATATAAVSAAEREDGRDGYGLTLTYNPVGPLQALGILDAVAEADCPSRAHYLLDAEGCLRGYFGNAYKDSDAGWGQRGNLRVPRHRVRQMLLAQLQHSTLCFQHRFVDIMRHPEQNEAVEILFEQTINHQQERPEAKDTARSLHNGTSCCEEDVDTRTIRRRADLVIAADGIRSRVLKRWIPAVPPPQSLHIRIILGLTRGFLHPLLDEKGFYTLSEGVRLFVMPYAGNKMDPQSERRFMWQLSFQSQEDEEDCKAYSAKDLKHKALELCRQWHAPVFDMIHSTPLDTIWGTMLCDRDPVQVYNLAKELPLQRLLVVGDALHAMSPFKGQGANQALSDGRTVATWLDPQKSKTKILSKAVNAAMRDLVQRTQRVVLSSREAARFWHSPEALVQMRLQHKFAGVPEDRVAALLEKLKEKGIRGDSCGLESRVQQLLREEGIWSRLPQAPNGNETRHDDDSSSFAVPSRLNTSSKKDQVTPELLEDLIAATQEGNLSRMRRLSWGRSGWIRSVRIGPQKMSMLHLAVQTGQRQAVLVWLVREAGCALDAVDEHGQTPLDYHSVNGKRTDDFSFQTREILMRLAVLQDASN